MRRPEYLALAWDMDPDFEVIFEHTDEATCIKLLEREGYSWERVRIEHTRGRFVPERENPSERDSRFVCPAKGRGSFPVTLVYEVKVSACRS